MRTARLPKSRAPPIVSLMQAATQSAGPRPKAPEGGKARRVYLLLRDRIAAGAYGEGASLPGEQRLAASLAVSRVTVRRALGALAADGLVERRAGSGTTVRAPSAPPAIAADLATLMPHLGAMERATVASLLSCAYGPAPDAVARAMGLHPGARVQAAVRVRSHEGRVFSHLTTHVPEVVARRYSEADLATVPLFRLLERSGVRIGGAEQRVTASLAGPEVAEVLGVEVGAALLSLVRIVRDAEGRAVEHLSALYRPDLFHLSMRMSRVGGTEDRWRPVIGEAGDEPTAAVFADADRGATSGAALGAGEPGCQTHGAPA